MTEKVHVCLNVATLFLEFLTWGGVMNELKLMQDFPPYRNHAGFIYFFIHFNTVWWNDSEP